MSINEMSVSNIKVGDTAMFKHRVTPSLPMIEEVGEILSTGVTSDAKFYVVASVGSHTKKFVINQ